MKTSRFNKYLAPCACALSVSAAFAIAQSNNGVPGPEDYPAFSHFIADRNIFDPNRLPHNYNRNSSYHPRTRPRGTPGIQLVGTMNYDKGMFAFFNGNSDDLSQVLQAGNKIQGYTITEITTDSVALESADKKEPSKLRIGDGLREENGKWIVSDAADMPTEGSAPATAGSSSTESTSSTPATPPSTGEQSDVLKRLMQLREKENQ